MHCYKCHRNDQCHNWVDMHGEGLGWTDKCLVLVIVHYICGFKRDIYGTYSDNVSDWWVSCYYIRSAYYSFT